MKPMRVAAFAAVLSALPALAAPTLELEVGGGAFDVRAPQPTITGRVGVDLLGFVTPSFRVTSLTPLRGASSAWLVLGEARLHTPGPVQLTGGVALGFATAHVTHAAPLDTSVSRVSPWLQADLGLRVVLGRFWIGVAVTSAPLQSYWMGTLNLGASFLGG
jgi:hypothetical protein